MRRAGEHIGYIRDPDLFGGQPGKQPFFGDIWLGVRHFRRVPGYVPGRNFEVAAGYQPADPPGCGASVFDFVHCIGEIGRFPGLFCQGAVRIRGLDNEICK